MCASGSGMQTRTNGNFKLPMGREKSEICATYKAESAVRVEKLIKAPEKELLWRSLRPIVNV